MLWFHLKVFLFGSPKVLIVSEKAIGLTDCVTVTIRYDDIAYTPRKTTYARQKVAFLSPNLFHYEASHFVLILSSRDLGF